MIITLAVRVVQLLFSAVVLALSVVLIKGFGPPVPGDKLEKAPEAALMDYAAFCGGIGLVIGAVGVAATFLEALQGIVILALDGLVSLFLFAGAMAYAVKVGAGSCGIARTNNYLEKHLNIFRPAENKWYGTTDPNDIARKLEDDLSSRCREFQADTAFLWLLFAAFVGTLALTFLSKSSSRRGAIV